MNNLPFVSILVATYNDENTINISIESIRVAIEFYCRKGGEAELIIINDGSTDKTKDILSHWQKTSGMPHLKIIHQNNLGVTAALHYGYQEANKQSEYIVRMDGDAFFLTPDWLYTMIRFALLDRSIGGVGVNIILPNGMSESQGIDYFSGVKKSETQLHQKNIHEQSERMALEVDAFAGTCACIKREVWNIDLAYKLWTEDVDQMLTIRLHNYKNFVLTHLLLFHNTYGYGREKRGVELELYSGLTRFGFLRASISFLLKAILGEYRFIKVTDYLKRKVHLSPNKANIRETMLYKNNQYFYSKWGFNNIHIDLEYIKERYKNTELCWRWDESRKLHSQEILKKYHKVLEQEGFM